MPNVPSGSSFDSFDRGLRSLLEEPVGPRRTGAPVAEDDDPFLRDLGNLLETERAAEEAPRPRIGVPALPSREVPAPPEPSVFDLTDAQARTPFEMGGMLSPQRTADIPLSPVAPPAPVLAAGGINAAADVASMRQSVSTFRAGAGLAERFGERILGPMIATAAPKVADVGISAVKGSIGMVEAGVGALDLATESTGPSQAMARMGFQPAQAKAILDRYYSAPQRQAFAAVEEADGLLSKTRAVLENPSVVLHSVVESAPTMVAAAAVARGSGLSPAVAGPLGEAVLSAGATNAAITQDNPAASDRERAIALASGAATGLLGNFSGRLAKSLGVTDIDTLLAGAALSPSAGQNLARRIIIGAVQEGFLEELPQSVQEQIAQNLALRRQPWDGVDDAAVLGALTGAAMGGGTQMFERSPGGSQSRGPATFSAPWNPRGLPEDGVRPSAPAQEAQAPAPPPQAAPPPVPPPAAPPVARARQEEAPPVEAPPPAQTVEPAPVSQEEAPPPSESDLARERAIDALMAKLEAEAEAAPPADEDTTSAPRDGEDFYRWAARVHGITRAQLEADDALQERLYAAYEPADYSAEEARQRADQGGDDDAIDRPVTPESVNIANTVADLAYTEERIAALEALDQPTRDERAELDLAKTIRRQLQNQEKLAAGVPRDQILAEEDTGTADAASPDVPRGTVQAPPAAGGPVAAARSMSKEDFAAQARRWNFTPDAGRVFWDVANKPATTDTPAPAPETRAPQAATNGPTVTWDEDHKSVTVTFPKKPLASTLDALKKEGFRWSKASQAWFHRTPGDLVSARPDKSRNIRGLAVDRTRAILGLPSENDLEAEAAPASTDETPKHDYASTQVDLPPDVAAPILAKAAAIPEEDLAEKGREDEPHITVKYGITDDAAVDAIRSALATVPPIRATLGATSIFDTDEADVLKVDVDSPDLHAINKAIADAVPTEDTYPTYQPHVTIAYLKKGKGADYTGDDSLRGQELVIDRISFRGRDETATEIMLGGTRKTSAAPAATTTAPQAATRTASEKRAARLAEMEQRLEAEAAAAQTTSSAQTKEPDVPRGTVEPTTLTSGEVDEGPYLPAEVRTYVDGIEAPDVKAFATDYARWLMRPPATSDADRQFAPSRPRTMTPQRAMEIEGELSKVVGAIRASRESAAPVETLTTGGVEFEVRPLKPRPTTSPQQAVKPSAPTRAITPITRTQPSEDETASAEALAAKGKLVWTFRYSDNSRKSGRWIPLEGQAIKIPTAPDGYEFAVYYDPAQKGGTTSERTGTRTGGPWRVIEQSSGGAVGKDSLTKAAAIASATEQLSRVTSEQMAKAVETGRAVVGPRPDLRNAAQAAKAPKAPRQARTPQQATKPEKAAPVWTDIGLNRDGQTLYEDERGVRSIVQDGVRQTEPVRIVPRTGRFDVERFLHPEYLVATDAERAARTASLAEAPTPKYTGLSDEFKAGVKAIGDRRRAELAEKRAALKDEIAANIAAIKAEVGKLGSQANSGIPVPSKKLIETVYDLAVNYAKLGIVDLEEGWSFFQEDYGQGFQPLRRAFEMAWGYMLEDLAETSGQAQTEAGAQTDANQTGERDDLRTDRAGSGDSVESPGGSRDTGPADVAGQQPVDQGVDANAVGAPSGGKRRASSGVRRPRAGTGTAVAGAGARTGAGTDAAGAVDAANLAGAPADIKAATARGQAPRFFTIDDTADLTDGGAVAKLENNLAALRLLKALEAEGRLATADEQAILAKYIGWGHTELRNVVAFDAADIREPRQKQARQELDRLLTAAEIKELGESTPNAHYSFVALPRAMWSLVQRLGFAGGSVLEPAIGTGHFIGTMPAAIRSHAATRVFGVDKEPIAAAIAKHLYQDARIQAAPLQEAVLPENYFDLIISNVPFGKIQIFDPAFVSSAKAPMARSVHNYYFAKALDLARPGGLVVFVTSRFTMDAQNDTVRAYLAERAHFLGAFRMSSTAFKSTAGTDVVTDVIVLQKKGEGIAAPSKSPAWMESVQRDDLGRAYAPEAEWVHSNEYFVKHPKRILGTEARTGKMNQRAKGYNVEGAIAPEDFARVVKSFEANVYEAAKAPPRAIPDAILPDAKHGTFVVQNGKLFTYDKGTLVPSPLKGKGLDRALTFVPIRDAYQTVLDVLVANGTDAELAAAQRDLKTTYDAFVAKFGHVNVPENARIIEMDPNGSRVTSLEQTEFTQEKKGGRKTFTVTGLADIFTSRLMAPPVEPTTARTAQDALVYSLAWKGSIQMPYMEALTGRTAADLAESLRGEMFLDPIDGQTWMAADHYLSGDVVTRLAQATAAADVDPRYQENVEALQKVQPTPKTHESMPPLQVPFGAVWVPTTIYEQFLQQVGHITQLRVRLQNSEAASRFYVDEGDFGTHEFMPQSARSFGEWAEEALNGERPTIRSGKPPETDHALTAQHRESLDQLRDQWGTWWMSDEAVATKLSALYNAQFNRTAPRKFDGSRLVTPNANPAVTLRAWQKNAVWRVLQAGNAMLAHAVGAGKTYEMIAIAGEWRRLGIARKPMIVVPNHLIEQWRQDFMTFYPSARVLVPTASDFDKQHRARLITKIANNDWDVVIMAQSQFLRISVKPETLKTFVLEQENQLLADGAAQLSMSVDTFDELVTAYGDQDKDAKKIIGGRGTPRSVKDIARAILRLRARLQKRLNQAKKDAPVAFEELGVDALEVDEAHLFKNLYFSTSKNGIAGLKGSDADRALDMFLKVRLINSASGSRNVVFATGTPVSNTMSEVYTVFRYLAQDRLAAMGMAGFDAWANNFAVAAAEMEPKPGGGYKERVRLRDWVNLKELSALFRQFTDVFSSEDLRNAKNPDGTPVITIPAIKGGKPTVVSLDPHPDNDRFMESLRNRLDALQSGKVDPKDDNNLLVNSHASLAAVDMRLVDAGAEDYAGSRIRVAARKILERYRASQDVLGTQLVFLDVGTPKTVEPLPSYATATTGPPTTTGVEVAEATDTEDDTAEDIVDQEAEFEQAMSDLASLGTDRDLYGELKRLLIAGGIPAEEIAFIHQAKNPLEQRRLFKAMRDGKVRVMLATTMKGGVGMNVQTRLVALHHLDVPWRPADIEQREGRILRQGNLNEEIEILRYVTKDTFDEFRWGLLATKQRVLGAFLRGDIDTLQDLDTAYFDYQVTSALSSKDPRALELLNAERAIVGLRARFANFSLRRQSAAQRVEYAQKSIARLTKVIETLEREIAEAREWAKAPTIKILMKRGSSSYYLDTIQGGTTIALDATEDRKTAGAAIERMLGAVDIYSDSNSDGLVIATAGPFEIRLHTGENYVSVDKGGGFFERVKKRVSYLSYRTASGERLGQSAFWVPDDPTHQFDVMRSLSSFLTASRLDEGLTQSRTSLRRAERDRDVEGETLTKRFEQQEELDAKERELHTLRVDLGIDRRTEADGPAPAAPDASTSEADSPSDTSDAVSDASVMPGTLPVRPAPTAAAIPKRTTPPTQARRLEVPELLALAKALLAVPDLVKSFRKAEKMSEFRGWGGIRLSLDLFKPGNEQMLAEVLAHEIGHLIDWLPDHTMTRGNLLGRLNTLRQYMRHTYVTPSSGMVERLKVIRPELIALSKVWRPWDRETATDSMRQYRDSSRELYADALSALLNDPGFVKAQAPKFYDAFFEGLHEKPDAEQAYLDLLDVVNGGQVDVTEARRGRLVESFETGDVKAKDIRTRKDATKAARAADLWTRFRVQLFTKHTPFADRVRQLAKQGTAVAELLNPVYALDERNYLSGKLKAWVQRHVQPLKDTLDEVNVPWSAFGELLFYDRIISGDSSEKANPQGLSVPHVTDMRERLRAGLSATQWRTLTEQTDRFREAVKDVARMAYEAGLYTEATWNDIEANPAYATFRVLDYMDQELSSRVMRRVGTLKDIQHPGDATVLKTLKTLSAIEHNRVKTIAITFLRDNFAADIEPARTLFDKDRKLHRPIPPPTKEQRLVTFYEKGKWTGVYVDPYIADSLDNLSYGHDWFVTRGLRWINGKWFRQVFTGLNLGFQSYNLMKDFIRYWKNNPGWSPATALRRYYEAVPLAKIRAWGLPAKPTAADLDAFETLLQAEEGGMLALTFNDILDGREPEETQIEQTLRDVGALPAERASAYLSVRAWSFLMEQIRKAGDFVETLPKAAAIYDSVHRMQTTSQRVGAVRVPSVRTIGPERREFIRRKIGSPDFLAGGTYTPLSNELFLFSNAIVQGWRADIEVARDPNTRAGWFWKTMVANVLPKVLMFAALAGWFRGDDDKDTEDEGTLARMMRRISEYDLTNYTVVPLGETAQGFTAYVRLPQDDTGRIIGGLVWKALQAGFGDRDQNVTNMVRDVVDYSAGQLPSVSPVINVASSSVQFLSGRNVYDPFRGELLLTEDEMKARNPRTGLPPASVIKKFVGYEFQELGGGIVWRFVPGEARVKRETGDIRFAVDVPLLSDVAQGTFTAAEWPIVSNLIGRWLKVSNQGEKQALDKAVEPEVAGAAYARLEEKRLRNVELKALMALPKTQRTEGQYWAAARRVVEQVYAGQNMGEKAAKTALVVKKLQMGEKWGDADPIAEKVLLAGSIPEKVAVLRAAQARMSADEWRAWVTRAQNGGIVSEGVWTAFSTTRRPQEAVR